MASFNKIANRLRRLDEADPASTLMNPAEIVHGGFSADMARRRRGAKSNRKAARRVKASRRMRLS